MRVAVVTPFYKTNPAWLAQCHASVRAQTHPCTHILVSDGSGENPLADFSGQFIRLEHNHADFGDTPRAIGSFSAIGQGFDAIVYLDADNWYLPRHIESLVALCAGSGAAVCSSRRTLHALDGTRLGPCAEVDGEKFVDTSCLFLTRAAFAICCEWALIPARFHVLGDRWIWSQIRNSGLTTAHSGQETVTYRTSWPHHYRRFGLAPPPGAKPWSESERVDHALADLRKFLVRTD